MDGAPPLSAGIGERESVADVARVLGRQAAAIVWRTYAQSAIEDLARHAGVPVVNALTDDFHPCQLLADLPALEVRFNEHPTARNPLGAKGAGQAGAIGAPQTVMGAIADALGIAHLDMPATPESQ